jgi:uncharacterized protein
MKYVALGALCLTISLPLPAWAADLLIGTGPGASIRAPIKSLAELRFRHIVRQQHDFSCGSAALATLLTHHYSEPVDEPTVLQAMYEVGDKEKIRKVGFSMMDMKQYLASRGLSSDGYKVSLERIEEVGVPAIALINNRGYMHFVVIKGINKRNVLIGDPAKGLKVMSRKEFGETWNGIVFIINDVAIVQSKFNRLEEWELKQHAVPVFSVDNASLSRFTLDSSFTPNYF